MKQAESSEPPADRHRRSRWITSRLGQSQAFRSLTDADRKAVAGSLSRIVDYWLDAADREAPPGAFLAAADFPGFVGDLIEGVFDAIVDASIRQMEAYKDLLEGVAQSVDRFIAETVTDDDARRYLSDTFPDVFTVGDGNGNSNGRIVGKRPGASESRWDLALSLLGLPEADRGANGEALSKRLIQATRRHLVRERQQLLATMVLMGVQRIVDPDGRYRPKFKLRLRYRRKNKRRSRS
jgi:hypothetical protein